MASVDDRIVAMKFDNAAFEQKIATTMGSLDKLKGSLDFANSKRGLEDLSTASNNFNLSGISTAVEGISSKFTVMGAVAFTVISNIVTSAMHAGETLLKSFSLDQIKGGFGEYELKLGAIQTIMSGTGASLDVVNAKLGELNTYSDKTIYSFKDMTSNIGKFTNAGVSLDQSVASIQGIANVAAISGANAEEASRAMYNFAQSLSSGSVKLMDWKSIETANMATAEFKTQLMDSAVAAGTLKKDAKGLYKTLEGTPVSATKGFNESLEQQWLTSEALTATLGKYADVTTDIGKRATAAATQVKTFTQLISTVKESIGSGWAQTFELIFGNFDEAKTLFTDMNTAIGGFVGKSADARNALLQGWKDLGGRTALIEGLKNVFVGLASILKPIHAAFRELFPPMTAEKLFKLTEGFRKLTEKLILTPAAVVTVLRIFRGIFSAFRIGIEVVQGIGRMFGELWDRFKGNGDSGIVKFLLGIADKISLLKEKLVDARGIDIFFHQLAQTIGDLVAKVIPIFDAFIAKVLEVVDYFVGGFTGMYTNEGTGIDLFANRVGTALGRIKDFIIAAISHFDAIKDKIFEVKDSMVGIFDSGGEAISAGASGIVDRVSERFGFLITLGHVIAKIWFWVWDKVVTVWNWVWDILGSIKDKLGDFIGFIRDKFAALPQKIGEIMGKADYNQVLDTVNVGLFAGLVIMFKKFMDHGPASWIKGITDSINGVTGSLTGTIGQINGTFGALTDTLKTMQTEIKAQALLHIAEAVALLTVSAVILALIDSAALTKSMTAMAIGFGELVGTMALLDKVSSGVMGASKLTILAAGITLLAGAMILMAIATKIMSTMDSGELARGLTGIGVTLLFLSEAMKNMPDDMSGTVNILILAVALNILALAVKSFAEMSWEELAKGLIGVAGGLVIIAETMKLMPKDMSGSVNILILAVALNILALAVKSFAEMSWEEMGQGLTGIAGGLVIIALAMKLMPKDMSGSVNILILAVALNILALAVKSFAEMSWLEMAKGMVGIAGGLVIIAGAMRLMPKDMSGSVAILLVAVALNILALAVKSFAEMKWEEMARGMAGVAAVLIILAVAMHQMQDVKSGAIAIGIVAPALMLMAMALKEFAGLSLGDMIKGLVGLAAMFGIIAVAGHLLDGVIPTLAAFGVALILIGAGLALVGVAANLLAGAFAIIATAGSAGVAVLVGILKALIEAIPGIVVAFGDGLIMLAKKVLEALPTIIKALSKVIQAFLQLIIDNIPKLGEVISAFIEMIFTVIIKAMPRLAEVITAFIKMILDVIVENIPGLIAAGMTMIMSLLQGISDNIEAITTKVAEIIVKFLDSLTAKMPELVRAGMELLTSFLQGIADHIDEVVVAVTNIITTLLTSLGAAAEQIVTAGADALVSFLKGISDNLDKIVSAVVDLVARFITELGAGATKIAKAGTDALVSFLNGISDNLSLIVSTVVDLVTRFITELGAGATKIADAGTAALVSFLEGLAKDVPEIATNITKLITAITTEIGLQVPLIVTAAFNMVIALLNGIADAIDAKSAELGRAMGHLAAAFVKGIGGALKEAIKTIANDLFPGLGTVVAGVLDFFGIGSPSRMFYDIGENLMMGFSNGIFQNLHKPTKSLVDGSEVMIDTMSDTMSRLADVVDQNMDITPTITPVLDLTKVQRDASQLAGILGDNASLTTGLSYSQAASIAASSNSQRETTVDTKPPGPTEVKFEQIINAPTALSVGEIYRQTRNQITMAKEELRVS